MNDRLIKSRLAQHDQMLAVKSKLIAMAEKVGRDLYADREHPTVLAIMEAATDARTAAARIMDQVKIMPGYAEYERRSEAGRAGGFTFGD